MRFSSTGMAPHGLAVIGLVFTLAVGGCDGLTDVTATDVVDPESLANANGAATLYAGAIGTFTTAFAGSQSSQFVASGLIADEFAAAAAQGLFANYDLRELADPGTGEPYQSLHRARITALQAIEALQSYAPEPPARIGEMFAYVGYIETLLGETMCSGIPLSALVDQRPAFGEPLTTSQIFERAVADLDSALAYAGGSLQVTNLSSIGRARALLNLGRFAEAAAAVASVPTDFRFEVRFSASASNDANGYHESAYTVPYVRIVDGEGTNGLDFISANDPRVELDFAGPTAALGLPLYRFTKYDNLNAPVELASGIEARLIEAEAAYQLNPDDTAPTGTSWLGILNNLRATAISPALHPLVDPGTRSAREDLIFREKAFWTFGTGRRLGDLRRMVRQYGRSAEAVFPIGLTAHGTPYGEHVNLAPPESQQFNPNYTRCIDREA